MQTTVSELDDSRARVEAEVPAADVDRRVQRAARALGREMRLPGFRKGKVPPKLVLQQLGFDTVFREALREAMPEWYEQAVLDSGVSTVGDPEIEITSPPEDEGQPLGFGFEVRVLPRAKLGDYKGLEVGKADPDVPDDVIDRELEKARESMARLEPVERAAAGGDVLLIDFAGTIDGELFEGGEGHDQLLELGAGQFIEGFEEQLAGAEPGSDHQVEVTFPEDYRAEHLAGKEASFAVKVKEVREKALPDLDDDFASEASEFDTLEELRADIAEKLSEAAAERIDQDFRMAAIDAAAEAATVEIPDEIAAARAEERWEGVERQLAARGIDPNTYLQMQGRSREQLIEESRPDAERDLRREAVLAAVAEAEGIEVSEEEMVEALEHTAQHERTSPEKLLERLRREGRDALVSRDLRTRKAIEVIVDSAKPIPMAQAEAREKLWTPEDEREQAGSLWTPGDG
ncbi:MAG: trigger factor [Solirubrobacterales bacterium]